MTMSICFRFSSTISLVLLLGCTLACKKQESEDFIAEKTKSYTASYAWECASGTDCQDVFQVELEKGAKVSFTVNSVSEGSVAQIALYLPGTALGSTNLFTMSSKERRCTTGASCKDYKAGEAVNDFVVPQNGIYLFAITREWGTSCGGTGTYQLGLKSNQNFSVVKQTAEDSPSKATGFECVK